VKSIKIRSWYFMATSIRINDDLMRKLKLKSEKTGLNISELVENYLSTGLDDSASEENVSPFVDFDSMNHDDGLGSLIGIAQAGYTDDVEQLKKDSRRF
jgi:lipopolysaccharide biosynthesis regulator YciM